MNARQMKVEMTLRERRQRRAASIDELTPGDRAEVEKFGEFLRHAQEPLDALVQRFGQDYLGLSDAEVAQATSTEAQDRHVAKSYDLTAIYGPP